MPPGDPRHAADDARVVYVLKRYPRLSETFILTEILAHERAGLDIEIVSLRAPTEGRFHEALARVRAPVTYLRHERVRAAELWTALHRVDPARLDAVRDLPLEDAYQALILAPLVLERGVTHLHAHFATAATDVARAVSRLTGIPYSFTAHAKDIFHESVDDAALARKLRDAHGVVTVSAFNERYLRERFGAHARGVRRIYNGLDLREFPFDGPRAGHPVILGVGRLVEKKGFDVLIEACAALRSRGVPFECRIIGDGECRPALAARVRDLGLEGVVKLLGPRSRGEVIDAMRRATVLAAPCVVARDGNQDGLPTVLLEAMALGTPCVSTDVTGIPEAVRHDETGLIVPQNDAAALANAMAGLLDDPDRAARLAERARALIEDRFDIDRNAAALRSLFLHAAPDPAPPTVEALACE